MVPKPGDEVTIVTSIETLSGTLMPRPEILGSDITVLKLENGYNIGIESKKIKKISLIKKYEQAPSKPSKIKHIKGLPTIAIVSTGGTISARLEYTTGGVSADYTDEEVNAQKFIELMPELASIANLRAKRSMSVMSEDLTPSDWIAMAEDIKNELNNGAQGVVVTHGTDTLHYTAAALSFMLKDVSKPVIITGAQRSIDRGSSDAFMNLFCSIVAAANAEIAGVMTCLHGSTSDDFCFLIMGTKVRKMHTLRRDAFRAINQLPLAKVYADGKIEYLTSDFKKKKEGIVEIVNKFEPKTALLHIHPGINPELVDFFVQKKYRGIVIAATALGHVPTDHSKLNVLPSLKKAAEHGMTIVIATQTLYGRVHPLVYTNLRKLSIGLGAIFVEDMLAETAYVKLGWVLAQSSDPKEIKRLMLSNIAGEISLREPLNAFLS